MKAVANDENGINLSNTFLFILSSLVAFQLLFVSVYLLTHKKGNRRNNRVLGFFFLLFSVSLADFVVRIAGVTFGFPVFHLIDDGFFFLYGPLIFFYVKGVVYRDFEFRAAHFVHLIPFCVYAIYLLYVSFGLTQNEQGNLIERIVTADLPGWMFLAGIPVFIFLFVYLWTARRMVMLYRTIIRNSFSSVDAINLGWLTFTIKTFMWIVVIAMIHNVIPILQNAYFQYASLIALLVFTFYFVNRVLFRALNQPEIFSGIKLNDTEKYSSSRMSDTQREELKKSLEELMEKNKEYLKPDLVINDLAVVLGTTPKNLSQVINQGFGKSFYDYVNSFRCKAVQQMLLSDTDITILEAMYQGGFNSKSSFNKEFKKLTGLTPSEFKKKAQKSTMK